MHNRLSHCSALLSTRGTLKLWRNTRASTCRQCGELSIRAPIHMKIGTRVRNANKFHSKISLGARRPSMLPAPAIHYSLVCSVWIAFIIYIHIRSFRRSNSNMSRKMSPENALPLARHPELVLISDTPKGTLDHKLEWHEHCCLAFSSRFVEP